MQKKLLSLSILLACLVACRQPSQKANDDQQIVTFPNLVNVNLTGKIALPDSSKIFVNTDENTLQPLLSGQVLNGTFALKGQLDEPNFYNLVVGKEKFKVYLENGKRYNFVGDVANGKVSNGRIETDSKATLDYMRLSDDLQEKIKNLQQQQKQLRATFDNPETYQSAVEQSAALTATQEAFPAQLKKRYISDPQVAPSFKLFLIKEDKIGRANYEFYYQALSSTPDSLKGISLYRQAEAKVKQVRDFYENMPDFPDIHPRNVAGDSLTLSNLKDEGTLLFVFWGSWNREAKSDIALIKSNNAALKKLQITPIFLTWEKDFEAWEKASTSLGLGEKNYRLNAADQEFMVNHYAVQKLPRYILVNAGDRSIIEYNFTFPLDGKLVNKLKTALRK